MQRNNYKVLPLLKYYELVIGNSYIGLINKVPIISYL